MGDSKDTDIHKPNGVISEGEKVGHADKHSRIRRKDGVIFRGEEIGYVDENGKIRKPDGIIFRGEAVGQVKEGEKAHAENGIIFPGEEWGYVDDDGNIRQKDGVLFRGRIIGKVRGKNKAAALAYFVLRFKRIEERVENLAQKVQSSDDNKVRYLGAVRRMLEQVPKADALGDFDGLLRRLRTLEYEIVKLQDQRRARREDICRKAESLSTSTDWKETSQAFAELREKWKEIGSTGKEYEEKLWDRFRSAQDKFYKRRKAHFEKLEQEYRQNRQKKQSLCSKAESLSSSTDWKNTHLAMKQLQDQWKGVGYAGKDHEEKLWSRFRAAVDKFYNRRQKHYDKLKAERRLNRQKKQNLCSRAESLSTSSDWGGAHRAFRQLQEEWKSIGYAGREYEETLWQGFRAACDKFYERRKAHFDRLDKGRENNRRKKTRLCERAESLSKSTHWKSTHEELKSLMAEWKSIGYAGREYEEDLWQRFRAAFDTFYDRRNRFYDQRDKERKENMRRKERLIDAAESLAHSSDLKSAKERVKELQREWKSIGHVPREHSEDLWQRFRSACDEVFERAREEYGRKQAEWENRMEEVVSRKREQIERLRESIEHDEGLIDHWQDVIYNLSDGGRADEIRDAMESKISSVESRIRSKEERISELEADIRDIERKLR